MHQSPAGPAPTLETGFDLLLNGLAAGLGFRQQAAQRGFHFGDEGLVLRVRQVDAHVVDGALHAGVCHQGAHAGGDNNIGNLGICLIGNFEIEHPSRAAIQAMDDLIEGLLQKLQLPRNSVRPHHYWKATRCPGRHLEDHLLKYR